VPRPVLLQETPPDRCQLCGEYAELRPYGPAGEEICYACGMKDEETTKRMFYLRCEVDEI
jgi:hypothetical protein